ncbi:MAG: carbonate dehydratase [Trueperaceae bacterium]|nr:carbonate dehydratase [Trueperaceae bacterium]
MKSLEHLLKNNTSWAQRMEEEKPGFFETLSQQQTPKYFWIGCADSRVPANQIIDLLPGDVFVHRNVANVVVHTDMNCLSVLQFAVEVLKVEHIIVCGHYGCGGVKAALENKPLGLIDNWLRHIRDVYFQAKTEIDDMSPEEAVDRLCELNVLQQAKNVCRTDIVQKAWSLGQNLTVHAWIYGLKDGLLRDLDFSIAGLADFKEL